MLYVGFLDDNVLLCFFLCKEGGIGHAPYWVIRVRIYHSLLDTIDVPAHEHREEADDLQAIGALNPNVFCK